MDDLDDIDGPDEEELARQRAMTPEVRQAYQTAHNLALVIYAGVHGEPFDPTGDALSPVKPLPEALQRASDGFARRLLVKPYREEGEAQEPE